MRILLDTHAFIWWDGNPEQLSAAARAACLDPDNELVLSLASVWEMQVKASLGKLALDRPLPQILAEQVDRNGLTLLPVSLEPVLRLASLPTHHKDPFDRLIVAQALVLDAPIITHDRMISRYPVKLIW